MVVAPRGSRPSWLQPDCWRSLPLGPCFRFTPRACGCQSQVARRSSHLAIFMAPEGSIGALIRLDITKPRGKYVVALLDLANASRRQETALGDFVADSFRAYHGNQIGWSNGGGLRAEAPGPRFTTRDAYSIAPFDNRVMAVQVCGAGIVRALEQGVARVGVLGGGFPQVSGMSYAYSASAPVGSRISDVRVAGTPIDVVSTYSVAVTNYVFGGGDAITGFATGSVLVPASQAPSDAEAIVAHAMSLGVIDVTTQGRVTTLP